MSSRLWVNAILLISFVLFLIYIAYLDDIITERMEGRKWSVPASVYARPLELYTGKYISQRDLLTELDLLKYKRVDRVPSEPGQYRSWKNHIEISTRSFQFWDENSPGFKARIDFADDKIISTTNLFKGSGLSIIRLDPVYLAGIFPDHNEDRHLLKLETISAIFIRLLLAVEDRRFYDHYGVDPRAIARAFVANIKAGETVQGGSTLTQQLVKNLFLDRKRTFVRKINEAFMALLLEFHYDKVEILETYINEVYLGQDRNRSIHGFGLASLYYFGKPLNDLSIADMSLLVGLVKGASYYDPVRNPERSIGRRNQVLQIAEEREVITHRQSAGLKQRALNVAANPMSGLPPSSFINLVRRQLREIYRDTDLRSEGLQIFTTLDPVMQKHTEVSIQNVIPVLDEQYRLEGQLQTAAIVSNPLTGDVLSVVGDRNVHYPGFNRALDAERQVGSIIKPVIYLSALSMPDKYTLASLLDDSRLRVEMDNRTTWEPSNYDHEFRGQVLLRDALVHSWNIPTVRLGLNIGLANIVKTLKGLGVNKEIPPYPSIILGAFSLSPMQVASIYQTFASGGFHVPLRAIHAVLDHDGNPQRHYEVQVNFDVNSSAVHLVNTALRSITVEGTARSLSSQLDMQVAGKTGTTDNLRDSWFAGFSGDVLAVVWMGLDDNKSTGMTGSSGALRLWANLMDKIAHQPFIPQRIANVRRHWVSRQSGLLSEKECPDTVELSFIDGSEPDTEIECTGSAQVKWLREHFSNN